VLTRAKADERQVLLDLLHDDPALAASRPGQILLADKNYYGRDFEASIAGAGIRLPRRARKGEPERPGGRFFKPLRQSVESIFDTLKGQLDLEQHGGHTPRGVLVRVQQRLLASAMLEMHAIQPSESPRGVATHDFRRDTQSHRRSLGGTTGICSSASNQRRFDAPVSVGFVVRFSHACHIWSGCGRASH
jgi:hypothetical protein